MLRHGEELAEHFRFIGHRELAVVREELVRKDLQLELLAKHGVPMPSSVAVRSEDDIESACEATRYPCIYKPVSKDLLHSFQNTHQRLKAIECEDADTLRNRLIHEVRAGYELVVQDKLSRAQLEDEVSIYAYADSSSRTRMAMCAAKLVEFPAGYGTSLALRLCWEPELLNIAQAVAGALEYRGMLEVECMRDARDGKWKVLEVNTRPWLLHHFAAEVGFNFVETLYEDSQGRLPDSFQQRVPSSELLARKWTMVDIAAIVEHVQGASERLGELIASLGGELVFARFSERDPGPGIALLSELRERHGAALADQVERLRS